MINEVLNALYYFFSEAVVYEKVLYFYHTKFQKNDRCYFKMGGFLDINRTKQE